jgi:hypothetical protein
MNNVHDDEPALFHTRWALSYLRGPLTRDQISRLMEGRKQTVPPPAVEIPAPRKIPSVAPDAAATESDRPVVPPAIDEFFLPSSGRARAAGQLLYRPALFGVATLHYVKASADIDVWENVALLALLGDDEALRAPWTEAVLLEDASPGLEKEPEHGARFVPLPKGAARSTSYTRWSKMLKTHLHRTRTLRIWGCDAPRAVSRPGVPEGEFRAQVRQLLHEKRDRELAKLRKRYAPKLARLNERIRRTEQRVERERSQYRQQKLQTVVSVGATLLGALFGRKLASTTNVGRATTAARGVGRASRERGDVGRAVEDLETLRTKLDELGAQFEEQLGAVRRQSDGDEPVCREREIRARKGDLTVERVTLVWTPWRIDTQGIAHADCDEVG